MKTKNISLQSDLQQVRQAARETVVQTLRPHGKLWGMDVFSWYKAQAFELENTLLAFPFPICWMGEQREVELLLEACPQLASYLHQWIIYDAAEITLPADRVQEMQNVLATASLEDALELLKGVKQRGNVMLFTASSENWKLHQEKFEFFVSLHQG